jgi:hypothetical protein
MGQWTSDGSQYIDHNVQLMGRNGVQTVLFNASAFTTTTPQTSVLVDISKYREIQLFVNNTHNQNINLNCVFQYGGLTYSIADKTGAISTISIPANTNRMMLITGSDLVALNAKNIPNFGVTCAPAVAPTSGSITVILSGVVN